MPEFVQMVDSLQQKQKIMLIAGEASGDTHAAKLVKSLRESAPNTNFEFFGATGEKMRRANVETIVRADDLSIVGLPEIACALPMFWNVFRKLKKAAVERRPDVVIFVDFPEFNLKLAKSLKKKNLKTVYYISPQLWAWRGYRLKFIKRDVDLLLTILPFEENWYRKRGFDRVKYVGNPSANEIKSTLTREQFCEKHEINSSKPIITLLPGSRHKEIVRILPILFETALLMQKKNPDLQFIIALAATRKFSEIDSAIDKLENRPKNLFTVQNETHEALNASDAAAVTSGTATLEAAIIGTPFAIVYKTSAFNWRTIRPLISVEHFGLVNLIAEQRVVTELFQHDFTPETLSAELFRLLKPENNREMREQLSEIKNILGHGGASKRAAEAILEIL